MSVRRIYWPLSRGSRLESSLKMGLALAIISLGERTTLGQSGPPQSAPGWTFCIHVENSAGVSSGALTNASKTAVKILLAAGVPTEWQTSFPDSFERSKMPMNDPSVQPPSNRDRRNCLILSVARGTPRNLFPGSLGFALPHVHSRADVTIFYDRIEGLERRPVSANATAPQILGYAMAHEIGHVLLDSTQHSLTGIMKGPWGEAEFQRLAKGWLGFTAQQGELMRESAFRRAVSHEGRSRPEATVARLTFGPGPENCSILKPADLPRRATRQLSR
jgi:hypothetical protein